MSRRVLIITYYWPPAGGAGVQRWLKFVKYLPEFGWEPVVYTVKNGEFPVLDYSLEKDIPAGTEVIRRKIFEPYLWYKKFIGQKPEERINAGFLSPTEKPAGKEKIARWIRGNLFIPDARKFWIRPSVRFLTKYLRQHPVDIIVSTGPPHSMHLIALGVKKKLNIPWVADFRDPWTKIDFYDELSLSKRADRKHHRLEKEVVRTADAMVSVTRSMQQDFLRLGARVSHYIPNGFDPDDFPEKPDGNHFPDKFRLLHVGSINPARNPETLWKVLADLVKEEPSLAKDLEIRLVGKTDISVTKSLEAHGLLPFVRMTDYVPHEEVFALERQAAVLLLLINRTPNAKGILTGKLFEYLAAGRPILALGPPDGEAALILRETNTGFAVDYQGINVLKIKLLDFYQTFKTGDVMAQPRHLESYSRISLTGKLSDFLSDLLGNKKINR